MTSSRKSLVILNGSKPHRSLIQKFWNEVDCRICADGAANTLIDYQLEPDVIIGDFDSASENIEKYLSKSKVVKDFDQNTTDGEKALNYCIKEKYLNITILGALGKRLDHTLYNLSLLKYFKDKTVSVTIYSDEDIIFLITGYREFQEPIGTRISLMPIFGEVTNVESVGLRYPLTGETLTFGLFSSISNVTDRELASISVGSGDLLVVIQR